MLAPLLLLAASACAAPHDMYEPHEHYSILRDASPRRAQLFQIGYGPHAIRLSLHDSGVGDIGWRWLNLGEGAVTFENNSLPHRPAAFPDWLSEDHNLPVKGVLVPFVGLGEEQAMVESSNEATVGSSSTADSSSTVDSSSTAESSSEPPERACVPVFRPREPKMTGQLALVERGGCDFATKVLAAQARGAAAVIVGDSVARAGETDAEGRLRENLITMFSPEDTRGIVIPSVFVSRASYLVLRDLLRNSTVHGRPGLRVEIGEVTDDGNTLGSLLTFALLMPSLFLIATVAAHRMRVARQREANRAPPTVVLSLPERVWSPDIVWEKDDSDSDKEAGGEAGRETSMDPAETAVTDIGVTSKVVAPEDGSAADASVADASVAADPDGSCESAVAEQSDFAADDEADSPVAAPLPKPRRHGKQRRKSKRYYSKDECAICMDSFQKGEVVRILPCGHVFHKDECDEWLLKWRKLCPTCRADVTLPAGDLSASATLTPVVERTVTPVVDAVTALPHYGAAGAPAEVETGAFGLDRLGARLSAAVESARNSIRQLVRGERGEGTRPAQHTERTPLVGQDV